MKKIIAIDIGNSETNVGVGNSTKWESYRYTTRKTITSDELLMMFKTTIDLSKLNDKAVDGVIVCSVVPQITDSVVSAISEFTTKDVLVVGPGIKTGLKISLDALISKTSSLKSVELKEPDKVIGKNTYEAIQSGLVLGHASMIDSMLEKIVLESNLSPGVVITGGLGTLIQPVLNINSSYEKNLTLDGLEEIYNLNN